MKTSKNYNKILFNNLMIFNKGCNKKYNLKFKEKRSFIINCLNE